MSKVTSTPIDLKLLGIDTDEIAIKTDWTPLLSNAASFRTLKLTKVNSKHIRFAPTLGFVAFSLLFFFLGLFLLSFLFSKHDKAPIFVVILGGIFFLAGVSLICFNKNYVSIQHVDGRWRLSKMSMLLSGPYLRSSSRIYAVQFLEKHIDDSESPYNAYELNLVYDSGVRENILNQGNYNKTFRDAVNLSSMLTIPFWNGVVARPVN
jgi:hypothetical protein